MHLTCTFSPFGSTGRGDFATGATSGLGPVASLGIARRSAVSPVARSVACWSSKSLFATPEMGLRTVFVQGHNPVDKSPGGRQRFRVSGSDQMGCVWTAGVCTELLWARPWRPRIAGLRLTPPKVHRARGAANRMSPAAAPTPGRRRSDYATWRASFPSWS